MGLTPSKVDDYVLRVEDNKPKFHPNSKPATNSSVKAGKGSNNQAVHPITTTIIKSHSSVKEQPPKDESYNYGHNGSHKTSANNSNKGSSRHQPQPSSSGGGQVLPSVSESGRPVRRLSHQASSLEQSAALVSTKSAKNLNIRCSVEYPWLVKVINLNGAALAEIEFSRIIGKGLMGTVRVCKTKADRYFVMKSIRKDYIQKHNDYRHVQNEKEALLTVSKSPFCIKLFGTFQDRTNIYFALEYAPGGELFHRLDKKKFFAPQVAKFYATEIFAALEHVQSVGFVYRDLKPENIILDEEGHCKLIDFGFAIPCGANDKMHTLCGTPAYLSPEQLDGKLTNGYTSVVDWWSFGVLIFELLTGKTPFCRSNRESHYEIFLRILKSKISFPRTFDNKSKELVSNLCHAQLERRLTDVAEIKEHSYFEIPWEAVLDRRLVPPFVPRLKHEGDCHYFDSYYDGQAGASLTDTEGAKEVKPEYIDF